MAALLILLALVVLFVFIINGKHQNSREIEDEERILMFNNELTTQEEEDLLTPEELVEEIFDFLENELSNNNLHIVCEQLPDVWEEYQHIIQSVSALYQRYLNLRNYC